MEKENINETLLIAVYQNVSTALQSINLVFDSLEDGDLKKEILDEKNLYETFDSECHTLARKKGVELKENNMFEKSKMWVSIKMSVMTDKSIGHIAEMMLLGSFMGEIDMYKVRHFYDEADTDIIKLCNDVYDKEKEFSENLKPYVVYQEP